MTRLGLILLLALAACGGKPAGQPCDISKPAECGSGACVTVTCPVSMVDKTICTGGFCDNTACASSDDCVPFPSGRKHCVPRATCN
jgi:hypothetical protein